MSVCLWNLPGSLQSKLIIPVTLRFYLFFLHLADWPHRRGKQCWCESQSWVLETLYFIQCILSLCPVPSTEPVWMVGSTFLCASYYMRSNTCSSLTKNTKKLRTLQRCLIQSLPCINHVRWSDDKSRVLLKLGCSVAKSNKPMDCSTPGFPIPHHLPKFAQVYVPCIGDTIQSSNEIRSTQWWLNQQLFK